MLLATLRASLSGIFFQTLPELGGTVTPLNGHSLCQHSCPPTLSASSAEMIGHYDCGINIASKHARKHEARPPRVKINKICLDSNAFGFICAGVIWATRAVIKETSNIIWVVCHKLTAIWTPLKENQSVRWFFFCVWLFFVCLSQTYCHLNTTERKPVR